MSGLGTEYPCADERALSASGLSIGSPINGPSASAKPPGPETGPTPLLLKMPPPLPPNDTELGSCARSLATVLFTTVSVPL